MIIKEKVNRLCKGPCQRTLRITDFANAGTVKGVKYYRHKCKKCYGLQKDEERDKNIEKYRAWKDMLSCFSCGYSKKTHPNFTSYALEFHHHSKDKSFSISEAIHYGYRLDKLKKEAKKCTVLCSRCHIEEHQHNKRVYTKFINQDQVILKHKTKSNKLKK